MNQFESTGNALRHGQIVVVNGRPHRVDWWLDNRLYLVDAQTNVLVARATGQNELRYKIERLERAA